MPSIIIAISFRGINKIRDKSLPESPQQIMTRQIFTDEQKLTNYMDELTLKVKSTHRFNYYFAYDIYQKIDAWLQDFPKVAPTIIPISGSIKNNNIQSYLFYSFKGGHLMNMTIYLNGYGAGEGTHVSVYLQLMKGPHDNILQQSGHWPLRGTFTINLLNNFHDDYHFITNITYTANMPSACSISKPEDDVAGDGWGKPKFLSHDNILQDDIYYNYFLLFFKISYDNEYPIAPLVLEFNVIKKVAKGKHWFINSRPFYAFAEGYLMFLRIGHYINTEYISLHLMKGPYDDKLDQSGRWPLKGMFTVELFNEFGAQVQLIFDSYSCDQCTNRVINNDPTEGWFVFYDSTSPSIFNNSFKISYEYSGPSTLPVTFMVPNFTEKIKSKKIFSYPFFAFNKGYLMFVSIYAAGADDGEGDHVSIYLYLVKGPFDDNLEQSGHWPLRGTFTIELINQFNNSDHYSRMIQFHQLLHGRHAERDLTEFIAIRRFGLSQFISHKTLHHHRYSYYKDDSIYFRASYKHSEPPYQIAPVTFKITNFSQWLQNKEKWYSTPFFTSIEGYQMCLRVDAFGYNECILVPVSHERST